MIDIVYTTKARQKHRFSLLTDLHDFEYTISRSSIVRDIHTLCNALDSIVSLQEYIDEGVNIKFEGTTPTDTAIIKLLPYDKTMFDISQIYSYLMRLEEKNKSLYAIIEMNLLADKYNDIYELYDDIRAVYKKTAVHMLSLYQPMIGDFSHSCYDYGTKDYSVPKETLYENMEQIEAAIRNKYGTRVFGDSHMLCQAQKNNTHVAEYHADIVNKSPYVRTDFYLKKPLTIEEISKLKESLSHLIRGFEVVLELPELGKAYIYADDPILTTEEMDEMYSKL